ncbi:MAG TPA: hypothetical protein VK915_07580 [Gaiellaceae bacterium]|nr:hypothetical protein [Gaiellaceae bacterium]
MSVLGILVVGAIVLVPLAREQADFRRSWGRGRAAALGLTALVGPAVGIGLTVALPLVDRPWAQWAVTVAVALAVRSVEPALEPTRAPEPPR